MYLEHARGRRRYHSLANQSKKEMDAAHVDGISFSTAASVLQRSGFERAIVRNILAATRRRFGTRPFTVNDVLATADEWDAFAGQDDVVATPPQPPAADTPVPGAAAAAADEVVDLTAPTPTDSPDVWEAVDGGEDVLDWHAGAWATEKAAAGRFLCSDAMERARSRVSFEFRALQTAFRPADALYDDRNGLLPAVYPVLHTPSARLLFVQRIAVEHQARWFAEPRAERYDAADYREYRALTRDPVLGADTDVEEGMDDLTFDDEFQHSRFLFHGFMLRHATVTPIRPPSVIPPVDPVADGLRFTLAPDAADMRAVIEGAVVRAAECRPLTYEQLLLSRIDRPAGRPRTTHSLSVRDFFAEFAVGFTRDLAFGDIVWARHAALPLDNVPVRPPIAGVGRGVELSTAFPGGIFLVVGHRESTVLATPLFVEPTGGPLDAFVIRRRAFRPTRAEDTIGTLVPGWSSNLVYLRAESGMSFCRLNRPRDDADITCVVVIPAATAHPCYDHAGAAIDWTDWESVRRAWHAARTTRHVVVRYVDEIWHGARVNEDEPALLDTAAHETDYDSMGSIPALGLWVNNGAFHALAPSDSTPTAWLAQMEEHQYDDDMAAGRARQRAFVDDEARVAAVRRERLATEKVV